MPVRRKLTVACSLLAGLQGLFRLGFTSIALSERTDVPVRQSWPRWQHWQQVSFEQDLAAIAVLPDHSTFQLTKSCCSTPSRKATAAGRGCGQGGATWACVEQHIYG